MGAFLQSAPGIQAETVQDVVETRQIAPAILRVLGLDPSELRAVVQEGTEALPNALQ